jgi:hypothetical protein
MDELTQTLIFINGLSSNISLYVQSEPPKTLEQSIREAQTYDGFMTSTKNNNLKFTSFLEPSSVIELNSTHTRQQRHTLSFNSTTTKDDCFKYGLCFYYKESSHRALQCPSRS